MVRELRDVGNGRAIIHGHGVEFDAALGDGKETFSCQYEALQKIIVKLRQYAYYAQKDKDGMPSTGALLRPFVVRDVPVCSLDSTRQWLGVRLSTHDGIPIDLAIDRTVAAKLVEALSAGLREFDHPGKSSPKAN
jgi:hypothetical protein